MKRTFQVMLSLAILMLAATTTFAQPPGAGGGRMGGGMMDPEQRAERQSAMMKDSLMLSDELTAEVKAVLLVYAKKMQEARTSANGDWEAMRGSMESLRKEQDEELQAVVGDENWAKWDTIRTQMMENRGQRGRGGAPAQTEQGMKKRKKKDTGSDNG